MNTDPNPPPPAARPGLNTRKRLRRHIVVRFTVKEALGISEYANSMLEQHERMEFSDVHSTEFHAAARALRKLGDALHPPSVPTNRMAGN